MRAAGAAAESEVASAAAATLLLTATDAMAEVAEQLKSAAAEERSAEARVENTRAATLSARPSVTSVERHSVTNQDIVMAAVPYAPWSKDVDEPWQMEWPKPKRERDEKDAWLEITVATHDKPTLGLDRGTRQRLAKEKGFTSQVLFECKQLMDKFIGKRASAGQIRELLQILPAGTEHKLEIDTQLLDAASASTDTSSYVLLLDYRTRISDLVKCVVPVPSPKRVVLKVVEGIWASDVAAGHKFFECVANRNRWNNLFKGLAKGDLFIVTVKGTLKVAAVGEVASAPSTKVTARETLYSMLLPERRADMDTYLGDANSFDVVQFRKVQCPPWPLSTRDLLGRIGAPEVAQWQGVVHISTNDGVHTRLSELMESWPRREKNA